MYTRPLNLIQFRLSGADLEALKAIAQEGESLNLSDADLSDDFVEEAQFGGNLGLTEE